MAVFEEDVLMLICGYFPQSGRYLEENSLYDELKGEWDVQSIDGLVMCLGDFNGHIGWHIDIFDGVHRGYGIGWTNFGGRILLEFCLEKELCVSNTWFMTEEKRKVTFRMGQGETEIVIMLMKKHWWFLQNVKAIPEGSQHALMVADIDKKKIRNVVRKTHIKTRKINLLKIRRLF